MSQINNVIYFGAAPGKQQIVAERLKNKGINLLRTEPSKVHVAGGPTYIQPNYSIYRNSLPLFMQGAANGTAVRVGSVRAFAPLEHKGLSIIPVPFPSLVVNWNKPIAEEVKAQMIQQGWRDIMVRGKPALIKDRPTLEDYRSANEKKCVHTTPAPENCMNMHAFRKAMMLARLVASFLRTHQYPAFVDRSHMEEFVCTLNAFLMKHTHDDQSKNWEEEDDEKARGKVPEREMDVDDGEEDEDELPINGKKFTLNLVEPFDERPIFYDEHAVRVKITDGLLFQYEPDLARFDRSTILDVVKKYFYHTLGRSQADANDMWQDLSSAMGVLTNTDWANVYAHIFKLIDIALLTQTVPYVMMTANNYDGIYLAGYGYQISLGENVFRPHPKDLIASRIKTFDPHGEALWKILKGLDMLEDARLNAFKTMTSINTLKDLIDSHAVIGGAEKRAMIEDQARYLTFPGDKTWEPTASNIERALSILSDPLRPLSDLPSIHHSVLFSTARTHLVWSAFGESAPSFLVPGGRVMSLSSRFQVPSRQTGSTMNVSHRDVTKIGAVLKPLNLAILDLEKVIKDSNVQNPFGNAIVNAAASHMNKVYEGESCNMILAALRKAGRFTVSEKGSNSKRGREEDEDSKASKRPRVDDM